MVTINNSELKKAFSDSTKTQLTEQPNQVDNRNVIPIIDVTPLKHKVCQIVKGATLNNATTATIYTTPTNQDFYLCTAQASYIKDVTSTATSLSIEVTTRDGANAPILRFATFTLTVGQNTGSVTFSPPIMVKRGSSINLASDTNVANIRMQGAITGYLDDPL